MVNAKTHELTSAVQRSCMCITLPVLVFRELTLHTVYEQYNGYQMSSSKEGRHASISTQNGWIRRFYMLNSTFLVDRKFRFLRNIFAPIGSCVVQTWRRKVNGRLLLLWAEYANESPCRRFFVLTYWSNSKCKLFRDKGRRWVSSVCLEAVFPSRTRKWFSRTLELCVIRCLYRI